MKGYYEIYARGVHYAAPDLESAIETAEAVGADCVSQIGGVWDEWEKCTDCGEWSPSVELNRVGMCAACATVERDHGRKAER